MNQRPQNFRLDYGASLGRDLVFAGLGGHVGSTYFHDDSPYGNHGTLTNMDPPTDWVWVPELGRWTLEFVTNDYVSGPQWPGNVLPDVVSISSWWRSNGDYTTSQTVSGTALSTSGCSGVFTFGYTDNKLEWWQSAGGPVLASTASISTDAWRHVAVRRSGSAGSWTVDLFINGILDNTWSGINDPQTSAGQRFCLARFGDYAGSYLNGRLADTTVHNRFLSTSEIQQLADPSNVMLDGLIQAPHRRVFKAAAAPGGLSIPIAMHHYQQLQGAN